MGRFTDTNHKFSVYDVSKGGGTTIRSWIHYKYKGNLGIEDKGKGYRSQTDNSYMNLHELGFRVEWFNLVPGEKICIKRDPIERFMSCYKDKVLREKRCRGVSFNRFVTKMDEIIQRHDFQQTPNVKFLKYHFAPHHKILGSDKSIYNHVFDISEIDTKVKQYLEDMWKIKLPKLHCRNQSQRRYGLILTKSQRRILEKRYEKDYQVGWC